MREVPREEWVNYLDTFSRQHEGWLVTIEVLGAEIGAQVEVEGKPLQGITAELKGGGDDSIWIIVGQAPAERVAHNVTAPTRVLVEQAGNGADMALKIEASGGTITLVRLRSAVLPEMVDGVVSE